MVPLLHMPVQLFEQLLKSLGKVKDPCSINQARATAEDSQCCTMTTDTRDPQDTTEHCLLICRHKIFTKSH